MPLQVGLAVSVPLAELALVINPPIAIGRVVLCRRGNPVKVRGIERHPLIGFGLPLVTLSLFFGSFRIAHKLTRVTPIFMGPGFRFLQV